MSMKYMYTYVVKINNPNANLYKIMHRLINLINLLYKFLFLVLLTFNLLPFLYLFLKL